METGYYWFKKRMNDGIRYVDWHIGWYNKKVPNKIAFGSYSFDLPYVKNGHERNKIQEIDTTQIINPRIRKLLLEKQV